MSDVSRHALGAVTGVLFTPLLALGLTYGVDRVWADWSVQSPSPAGLGSLIAIGLLGGILAGSRLSPVASLIGGLAFTLLGLAPTVSLLLDAPALDPGPVPSFLVEGYRLLLYSGGFLVVGVLLLTASCLPSRWRRPRPPVLTFPQPSDDVTRPMYRE